MAITVEWAFLCESVDVGPNDEIVSIRNIIRPHSGFGARTFPLTLAPSFAVSLRGTPGEDIITNIVVGEGADVLPGPPRSWAMPASGTAEIAVPCDALPLSRPCTLTFILMVNGVPALSVTAGVHRAT